MAGFQSPPVQLTSSVPYVHARNESAAESHSMVPDGHHGSNEENQSDHLNQSAHSSQSVCQSPPVENADQIQGVESSHEPDNDSNSEQVAVNVQSAEEEQVDLNPIEEVMDQSQWAVEEVMPAASDAQPVQSIPAAVNIHPMSARETKGSGMKKPILRMQQSCVNQ
ncbi:hypothetical protein V6N11_016455 [Hibiscus sabdariffa]|uniref:Uncharacterized protein n=1 Tax=Hibiscus sabdariffa TaxID=183260 RepID=A0ABR2TV22_9ROSI